LEAERIDKDEKKKQGEQMMETEYFLRYKEKCYDVGTRLKFDFYGTIHEGTIEWISPYLVYVRLTDGTGCQLSKLFPLDKTIIEIIEPVYYAEPQQNNTQERILPSIDDIFIGWVWYIVIMAVGIIFKDRWLIWIFATIIFFTWKNGGIKK